MHETKSGEYAYAGEAWNFHDWEFRALLKARALRTVGPSPRTVRDAVDGAWQDAAGAASTAADASAPRSSRTAREGSTAGTEDGETSDTATVEESRSRRNV